MRVKINYAGNEGSAPLSNAYQDPSSAGMVARATAQAASDIGGAVTTYLDTKMRRDASSISMDSLTRVQQESTTEFMDAQSKAHSTLNSTDPEAKISNIDLVVDNPSSKYHGKSFVDYTLNTFDDKVKGELSRVTNPYARQELQQRFSALRQSYQSKVMDYNARAVTESKLAGADIALNRMSVLTMDQPDMFTQNLSQLHSFLDTSGLDPATAEGAKRKFSPVLAEAAVMGYAKADPLLAEDMLKRKDSDFRPFLDAKQIEVLSNRVEQMKNQQAAKLYTDVIQSADSAEQSLLNTGREVPGFDAKLAQFARLDPERAAPVIEKIQLAREAHGHKIRLDGIPMTKLDDYVNTMRPSAGAQDFGKQKRMFDYLSDIADKQRKLAKDDPASLVDYLHPDTMASMEDGDLASKMVFRDQVLTAKGIDQTQSRLLTNAEADGIISSVKQSDPNQVLPYLKSLAVQVDATGQNYSWKLFHDLSARENGLDPMYQAVFAKMTDPDTSVGVTYDLLGAIKVRKDLDRLMAGDSKKASDFDTEVYKQTNRWMEIYLKGASSSRMTSAASMKEAVSTLAKYYYQSSGDMQSSVKRSYQALLGDTVYDTEATLQIPKTVVDHGAKVSISDKAVKRDLLVTQRQILLGNIKNIDMAQTFGPVYGAEEYKNVREDALRRAEWKTNEDYTGAYLLIKRSGAFTPVLKSDGKPFVVKFSDIMRGGIYNDEEAIKRRSRWFD
jgi:hypothetical protein